MLYFENGDFVVHFVLLYFGYLITLYAGNAFVKEFFSSTNRQWVTSFIPVAPSLIWGNRIAEANRHRLIKFRRLPGSADEDPKGQCLHYGLRL
jgi:hypothetical protein